MKKIEKEKNKNPLYKEINTLLERYAKGDLDLVVTTRLIPVKTKPGEVINASNIYIKDLDKNISEEDIPKMNKNILDTKKLSEVFDNNPELKSNPIRFFEQIRTDYDYAITYINTDRLLRTNSFLSDYEIGLTYSYNLDKLILSYGATINYFYHNSIDKNNKRYYEENVSYIDKNGEIKTFNDKEQDHFIDLKRLFKEFFYRDSEDFLKTNSPKLAESLILNGVGRTVLYLSKDNEFYLQEAFSKEEDIVSNYNIVKNSQIVENLLTLLLIKSQEIYNRKRELSRNWFLEGMPLSLATDSRLKTALSKYNSLVLKNKDLYPENVINFIDKNSEKSLFSYKELRSKINNPGYEIQAIIDGISKLDQKKVIEYTFPIPAYYTGPITERELFFLTYYKQSFSPNKQDKFIDCIINIIKTYYLDEKTGKVNLNLLQKNFLKGLRFASLFGGDLYSHNKKENIDKGLFLFLKDLFEKMAKECEFILRLDDGNYHTLADTGFLKIDDFDLFILLYKKQLSFTEEEIEVLHKNGLLWRDIINFSDFSTEELQNRLIVLKDFKIEFKIDNNIFIVGKGDEHLRLVSKMLLLFNPENTILPNSTKESLRYYQMLLNHKNDVYNNQIKTMTFKEKDVFKAEDTLIFSKKDLLSKFLD